VSDVEPAYAVGQTVEVTTVDVAQGGWCVARPDGLPVLFVRHALPGERVLARVTEVTSRFARADAIEVREASPDRVEPPCPNAHPGGCGGCDWQHASLPAQRALKAAVIAQQLRRVAGLELDGEITVEALPGDEGSTAEAAEVAEAATTAEAGRPGLGWRTRVQFAVDARGDAGLAQLVTEGVEAPQTRSDGGLPPGEAQCVEQQPGDPAVARRGLVVGWL